MKIKTPIHKSDYKRLLCPWSYDQLMNCGVPQVETEPMRLGTKIHEILAEFRRASANRTSLEILALMAGALEQTDTDEERGLVINGINNDPDVGKDRKIEFYFALDHDGRYVAFPEEEEHLHSDMLLAGRMDSMIYVPSWLKTEDLKSGWVFDRFQPEIDAYCLGGMAFLDDRDIPYDTVSFVYFWLRSGKRESIEVLRPGEDALQLKANLVDRIHRRVQFFERLEPMPIPGYHCVSCQFLGSVCPIGHVSTDLVPKQGAVIERFLATGEITPDVAPVVGMYLQRLEARASEIREKFKPWVEEHGAVRIGDTEWAITHTEKGEFNQPGAVQRILESDLPLASKLKALRVTSTTLKALRRDSPGLVSEIYDWNYVEKGHNQLRLRKIK